MPEPPVFGKWAKSGHQFSIAFPQGLDYSPRMYKYRFFPYPIGNRHYTRGHVIIRPKKVLPAAYRFIEEWQSETPEPHRYVEVKCFGKPYQKVFINAALIHTEQKKNPYNLARRYRFLPCVKDLLVNSEETPLHTQDGNLFLVGKAPPYNEIFKVVLASYPVRLTPELEGYNLVSFFPLT